MLFSSFRLGTKRTLEVADPSGWHKSKEGGGAYVRGLCKATLKPPQCNSESLQGHLAHSMRHMHFQWTPAKGYG